MTDEAPRYTYDVTTLRRSMAEFERAYGISSDEFYAVYAADKPPVEIPRFERHVWASFIEDVRRLEADTPTIERVRGTFAHA